MLPPHHGSGLQRAGPALTAAGSGRRRYNLTQWAIQLNELTPGLKQKLAPTDCRLRPDQRFTELGEYDKVCSHVLYSSTSSNGGQHQKNQIFETGNVITPESCIFSLAG